MRNEIHIVLNGLRKNLEIEDEYEEAAKDLKLPEVEILVEEEMLLRAMTKMGKSHRMEVSNYSASLDPEELIDWINELEDYFELENIVDPQRVKLAHTKLKGHVALW